MPSITAKCPASCNKSPGYFNLVSSTTSTPLSIKIPGKITLSGTSLAYTGNKIGDLLG